MTNVTVKRFTLSEYHHLGERKLSIYAEDGISNYWIFNLIDNWLEVYSESYRDSQGKFGYRLKRIVFPNESVVIPSFPDLSLDLSGVFPMQN
ncbi:Uma2 family endonuclease [Kamptonema sp. UHCC 0994]|uniref:Uma2 family endonuclease n=1 Tax=Kamptonema sp. UHCC 0994 TaxID=3031329 RepID=UPI0023B94AC9|nr:Uma2 family endonuclease [Kamptonema sp. UHCC 0994]MDF0552338.1 Uma2 family endonuclease [Kamptonema sp. UHCC 0994]